MCSRPWLAWVLALGVLSGAGAWRAAAQTVDPAVVGERILRLTAAVESLELALASQKRQLDALSAEVQQLRVDAANQGAQRPWVEDMRRLTNAIGEVDRKRIADNEQVIKILGELRKAIGAVAEAPRASAAPSRPQEPRGRGPRAADLGAKKEFPYVIKRGETLSGVLQAFNQDADKQGYRALTAKEVMDYNEITDERRIPEGATILLPLIPK